MSADEEYNMQPSENFDELPGTSSHTSMSGSGLYTPETYNVFNAKKD